MCCRLTVSPIDPEIARTVLLVGMFVPVYQDGGNEFSRSIPEEGTKVTATLLPDALHLAISPTISVMSHHSHKRLAASVYFEIAARYAEKVDGKITQMSNIGACIEDGVSAKVLAEYPNHPLDIAKICVGFQEILSGGHIHDEEADEPLAYWGRGRSSSTRTMRRYRTRSLEVQGKDRGGNTHNRGTCCYGTSTTGAK